MAALQDVPPLPFILGLSALLSFVFWGATRFLGGPSRSLPLPPGPPGLPVIGNMLDFPKERPWLKFKELGNIYGECESRPVIRLICNYNSLGDILSLRMVDQQLIIVNDYDTAIDLLEKRSSIYSSRTSTPMYKL